MLIHKSNILGTFNNPEQAANTDFSVIIIIEPTTPNTQLKWDFTQLFQEQWKNLRDLMC